MEKNLAKTRAKDSLRAFGKLTTIVDGEPRIISDPPLIVPIEDLAGGRDIEEFARAVNRGYRRTLQGDRKHLLERFRYVHAARKVLGVGSVGTRAWIMLMLGRDNDNPLFLQLKEAQPSVLEPFLGKSRYANHGQRAAGLLHDTLEKTATTRAELQHRFGTRVARLVESVSDDPSIGDHESRKRELRDRVAHADPDALAIFAADKIAKVQELAPLPPSRLHETATRAKLAHYRASLKMLRRVAPDGALVDRLDAELSRLLAPTATDTPSARATTATAHSKRSNQRGRTSRRA